MYIVTEYGIPHVAEVLTPYRPNRLAVMAQTWLNCRAYDGVSCYEARPDHTPSSSVLQRFLAHTVYNPVTDVEVKWHVAGKSALSDIVKEIKRGLEHDDDIIQQWFDGKEVIKLLESAQSFEDICIAVRAICGEHETDSNLLAYVERVLGKQKEEA